MQEKLTSFFKQSIMDPQGGAWSVDVFADIIGSIPAIVFFCLIAAALLLAVYHLIKAAVKNGIEEAVRELRTEYEDAAP